MLPRIKHMLDRITELADTSNAVGFSNTSTNAGSLGTSNDFTEPVAVTALRFGSRRRISLVSGVRSRMTRTTSNGHKHSVTAEASATWSLNTLVSA
jgi:hypothetical protein